MRFYNYIVSSNSDVEIIFLTGELPKNQGFHTKLEEAKFDVRVLPKRNILGLELYFWPDGLIQASDCVVCVISLASITNVYYAVVARLKSTPFYWWGHSQNFSEQGLVETLKDKVKLLSLVSSSGVLSYTFREKERFLKHRWLKSKNIISLGNTLDTENIFNINDSFLGHGLLDGSLEKTLKNKSIIGILGRLHQKRNASLGIELFLEILSDRSDLVLLIIGDGAEYYNLVDKYSSTKEIVFVGAIEEENELAHYMRRVDFFIHTGLVGLNLPDKVPAGMGQRLYFGYCILQVVFTEMALAGFHGPCDIFNRLGFRDGQEINVTGQTVRVKTSVNDSCLNLF